MSAPDCYILDTNILSDLMHRGRDGRIGQILASGQAGRIHTSVIVAAEIRYGVAKKGSKALAERAAAVLGIIPSCRSPHQSTTITARYALISNATAGRSARTTC